jgi:hypothetical protein
VLFQSKRKLRSLKYSRFIIRFPNHSGITQSNRRVCVRVGRASTITRGLKSSKPRRSFHRSGRFDEAGSEVLGTENLGPFDAAMICSA